MRRRPGGWVEELSSKYLNVTGYASSELGDQAMIGDWASW